MGNSTMIDSYKGLAKSYHVSKDHQLQYWDFAMEWFGFLISYSMYLDLHTIIRTRSTVPRSRPPVRERSTTRPRAPKPTPNSGSEELDFGSPVIGGPNSYMNRNSNF